jgi:hypothetical protein
MSHKIYMTFDVISRVYDGILDWIENGGHVLKE